MMYELPLDIENSINATLNANFDFEAEDSSIGIPAKRPDGKLYNMPILEGVNVLTVGVTGTGKTKSFILPTARALLEANKRRKGVFFETKVDFLKKFCGTDDKVVAYSPFIAPSNIFHWNMIMEIKQAGDEAIKKACRRGATCLDEKNVRHIAEEAEMRQIAEALFSDLSAGASDNAIWVEAAKDTFIAALRVAVNLYPDTSNKKFVEQLRNMSASAFCKFLAQEQRNNTILNKNFNYDSKSNKLYTPTKKALDILFFLSAVLQRYEGTFASDGDDTIHDYLHGKYGRNLFLVHDLATAQSSRPFMIYFLKKIKDEKMSLTSTSDLDYPMLWCMDEVDKLSDGDTADFGLFQAATLGREYQLQILLSTQSLESLYNLASNEHTANAGLAGFPVYVAFRPGGDPTTLSILQKLYGSERKTITTMPISRYDRPMVKSEIEPLVTELDFASLKVGEAYVKIRQARPQKVSFVLET